MELHAASSLLIVGLLLVLLLAGNEIGYRFGERQRAHSTESTRAQINTIQAGLLGILGLLLGFTFSLSLQRYDRRSEAVVQEANAIGTVYLRTSLLPQPFSAQTQALARQYLDLRIKAGAQALGDRSEWEGLVRQADTILDELWQCGRLAVRADGQPVVSGLFVQAMNDLIDAFGSRNAALDRHVPEVVLLLLFATFVLTGSVVGYTSGIVGHRPIVPTYILMSLIVVVVFLIVDLDRPRRGLVVVSQKSLVDLHSKIGQASASSPGSSSEGSPAGCRTAPSP